MTNHDGGQRDADNRFLLNLLNLEPVSIDPVYPKDGDAWFRTDLGIVKVKIGGVIYGFALIDNNTNKLIPSQTPALVINNVYVVNSQAEQEALSAVVGDVAIRTDENVSYILAALPPSTFSNWHVLSNITATVSSVNGQTGVVVLTTSDIAEGSRLYYTDTRFDTRFSTKSTSNLVEGSNLYYTQARFNSAFALKTTDDLVEGTGHLYYTNGRFDARFATKDTDDLVEGITNLYITQARFDTYFSDKDTDDLSEGSTHLYFSNAHFDTRFGQKSTTDLAEGSNLYFTIARVDAEFDTRLATKSTDDLSEGTGNLYFTNARADGRISLQKGQPLGLATLDAGGTIPPAQLPGSASSSIFIVASQVAMLALSASKGDIAKRTDSKEIYMLSTTPASTLGNWILISADYNANVDSVNGFVHTIILSTSDISEGSNLYYTQARFDSAFILKTTDDLSEGISNLYYTNTRFDSRFATKTTSDLTEGSNLYFTNARVDAEFDTRLATKTTDNLAEGISNLYFTTARANSAFDIRLATKTTDNLVEGSVNLYWTNSRFDTRFATKSTTDLTEGTNLYFTNARADARITAQKGVAGGLATLDGSSHVPVSQISITTDNVPEGATNLYYSDARADARIALQKGAANGIATLDAGSKIPAAQLPAIAITDTFVVGSQAAMLALTAQTGDIAVRTDLSETFILKGTDPTNLGDWQQLLSPGGTVTSVNGYTGTVVLTTTDIAEGTNLYYLDSRARAAISGVSPILYNSGTGAISIQKSDATHDGYLAAGDWTTFNSKEPAVAAGTTAQYYRGDKTFQTLNTSAVPEGTNLYYTTARVDSYLAAKGLVFSIDGFAGSTITNSASYLELAALHQIFLNFDTGNGGFPLQVLHNGTAVVTVLSTGNVGIGTTTPGQKLSVAGTIESTSGGVKFPDASIQTTAYVPIVARKLTDQSVATNVLTDDTALQITLVANTTYTFEAMMMFTNPSATPDSQIAFVTPSGTFILAYMSQHTTAGGGSGVLNTSGGASGTITVTATATTIVYVKGTISVGVTGGTFKLQFAQNGLLAIDPVTSKAGAYMRAVKV